MVSCVFSVPPAGFAAMLSGWKPGSKTSCGAVEERAEETKQSRLHYFAYLAASFLVLDEWIYGYVTVDSVTDTKEK